MANETSAVGRLLVEETIYLAEDHFDKDIISILSELAKDLGANITSDRQLASIILLNPSSPAYKAELDRIASFKRAHPNIQQIITPYHFLSSCKLLERRLDPTSLDPPTPFFTHPDRSRGHQPLRVWVSINITRHTEEPLPQDAYNAVCSMLVRGGALIVLKRSHADVLIVDTTTDFYKTVRDEKRKYKRVHQRLAERDWVQDCFMNRELAWRLADADEEDDRGEDSFGEEEQAAKARGPGRPTGLPRNEYTPSDDDFLVRYLAYYNPEGAWSSRKTYANLTANAARYPPATRHSTQSWHERFKKNSGTFAKRVQKMIEAGIDDSLKTRSERAKEAERNAAAAAESAAAGAAIRAADEPIASTSAINPPSSPSTSKSIQKKAHQKRASAAGKKALVGSDTESDPLPRAGPSTAAPAVSAVNSPPSAVVAKDKQPPTSSAAAAAAVATGEETLSTAAIETTTIAQSLGPAGDAFESLLPALPNVTAGSRSLQGDSGIVEAALGPDTQAGIASHVRAGLAESQQTNGSGTSANGDGGGAGEVDAGAETQNVLSDFERVQAAVRAARATAAPTTTETSRPRETNHAIPQPSERSAVNRGVVDNNRPDRSDPSSSSTHHRTEMPPPPRSAIRAPRISQTVDGKQRMSVPVMVNFRVVGVTEAGETVMETVDGDGGNGSGDRERDRRSRIRRRYDGMGSDEDENGEVGAGGHRRSGGTIHTPSPGRNRSLLREELMSSSGTGGAGGGVSSSRRKSRLSHGYSGTHHHSNKRHRGSSPDTVYATPSIPSAAPPRAPSITSTGTTSSARPPRAPSPPLSHREREARVLDGQAIARERARLYKASIERLCEKYRETPAGLYANVDRVKKKGETGVPWDELERRLDRVYMG